MSDKLPLPPTSWVQLPRSNPERAVAPAPPAPASPGPADPPPAPVRAVRPASPSPPPPDAPFGGFRTDGKTTLLRKQSQPSRGPVVALVLLGIAVVGFLLSLPIVFFLLR